MMVRRLGSLLTEGCTWALLLSGMAGCSSDNEPSSTGAAGSSEAPPSGGHGGGANAASVGGGGGLGAAGALAAGGSAAAAVQIFTFDNTTSVGGLVPTVLGAPAVTESVHGDALCFDGVGDALVFAENPIQGLEQFTVEVLMLPAADGPAEQRFVHLQEDGTENRAMLETRVTGASFYVDTFLRFGEAQATLVEPTLTHPTDEWHWVALSYAAGTGRHFANGVEEVSAALTVEPLGPGRMGVGVRLNLQYWYQGCIRELRVTSRALPADELQRVP